MNEATIRTRFPVGTSFLAQGESRVRIVEEYAATFPGAPDTLMLVHQKQGFWPSECRTVTGGQSATQPAAPLVSTRDNALSAVNTAALRAQLAEALEREGLRQQREQQLETERQALAELREREANLASRREASLREELNRERSARLALDAQLTNDGQRNLLQALRGLTLQLHDLEREAGAQQRKINAVRTAILRHLVTPVTDEEVVSDENSPYLQTRKLILAKGGPGEPHNND